MKNEVRKPNQPNELINLFPNLASTTITIHRSTQSTNSPNQLITITDVFGRIVFSQLLSNTTESTIDISHLNNGIYFYEIRSGNQSPTSVRGKFVKN